MRVIKFVCILWFLIGYVNVFYFEMELKVVCNWNFYFW